ncbi:hypothetical protein B0H14DRAFT_3093782 [Mycena olivaceomarginata]|nr:hypothetical protein B0H14DRAFT_3093782 [Mycena olivaceomarginata]
MLRQQPTGLILSSFDRARNAELVGNLFPFVSHLRLTRDKQHTGNPGEEHPVTAKRAIDGGISGLEEWKNGYIKIACEDFPQPAMNLKWASNAMDRLVAQANNPKHDLKDVPVDLRHVYAKARKAIKGEHTRSRVFARPSILDFPLKWIPERRRKYAIGP